MTRPRQVLAAQFHLVTRRCTQRQFLLRPDQETNNAFTYCLAEAAGRFEIDVVLTVAESNHHHTVIFDAHGRFPEFIQHFHKMLARCMNARLGRWENFWAAEEPCVTRLLDREAVIDKLVYTAANPVKDLLVERATQWPGVNGYRHFLSRKPMRARRPRFFFCPDGTMPEHVTLELAIPQMLGPSKMVIEEVRAGVLDVERATAELRASTGKRVVGRANVLRQSWRSGPTSDEPRRTLRPRFAGNKAVRIPALVAFHEFLLSYRDARSSWLKGLGAVFPPGTYWLVRFAHVMRPSASV